MHYLLRYKINFLQRAVVRHGVTKHRLLTYLPTERKGVWSEACVM